MEQNFYTPNQTLTTDIGAPEAVLEKVQEWKGMDDNLLESLVGSFSHFKNREQTQSLSIESLEKRLKDYEEREKNFYLFEVQRNAELTMREEKLDEQLKLVREHIETLEVSRCEFDGLRSRKLKEIEKREREMRESMEKRFREVEKREMEIDKIHDRNLKKLGLKEMLSRAKKQIIEEKMELKEKQKLGCGCGLIKKLELALSTLERMKVALDKRFSELESREAVVYESLTAKLMEADMIRESLEKRFKEFEKAVEEFNSSQEDKTQKLDSQEQFLGTTRRELLKSREEQLTEGQKSGSRTAESLKQMVPENLKSKKPALNVACEALDASLEDGESKRFSTDNDLELIGDDIFKLLLSPDPAKLVLDTVKELYHIDLGKGCKESNLRRVVILLLHQLTKMSPNINPCIIEAAIEFAREWMSKLNTASENAMEVIGLLHLVAAYNISSSFDKNKLFSFAKSVAPHKQTPELSRILGLSDKIPEIVQNLIHKKQYLLASTYISEFGLEKTFPQAAVLNYYVKHSKLSAKPKCRGLHETSEAQDKAIAGEIADLRLGIKHIIKYGLETDYSPEDITERIKQLERNRESIRCRSPSSDDLQKMSWDANRRDVWQNQHVESSSSPSWKAQNRQCKRERYPSSSPIRVNKHIDLVDERPVTPMTSACKRYRTNS